MIAATSLASGRRMYAGTGALDASGTMAAPSSARRTRSAASVPLAGRSSHATGIAGRCARKKRAASASRAELTSSVASATSTVARIAGGGIRQLRLTLIAPRPASASAYTKKATVGWLSIATRWPCVTPRPRSSRSAASTRRSNSANESVSTTPSPGCHTCMNGLSVRCVACRRRSVGMVSSDIAQ